ncbi:hypothetical protein L2D05_18560 [Alphaproteobacteria bacterium LMO-S08]|jgi:hypothetical protein|nr:hypothetical protein [Alphaproteobacteria bacterium LMO-S08]
MPRKFEGNAVSIVRPVRRQDGPLARMRAAVDALERETQTLRAEVGEFQGVIDTLRGGIENLAGSMEDYRFRISGIRTGGLHRAARRLGEIADNWQSRCARTTGAPSGRPSGGAA